MRSEYSPGTLISCHTFRRSKRELSCIFSNTRRFVVGRSKMNGTNDTTVYVYSLERAAHWIVVPFSHCVCYRVLNKPSERETDYYGIKRMRFEIYSIGFSTSYSLEWILLESPVLKYFKHIHNLWSYLLNVEKNKVKNGELS